MRLREIEILAARHVPGNDAPDIHRLRGGLINETYRVSRSGAAFALRLPLEGAHDLGVDREWEFRVLEGAAAGGLAPAVQFCDPRRGILITRWLEGRCWSPAEARQPSNIPTMAALMRRIHALPIPAPARLIAPANWIDRYAWQARGRTRQPCGRICGRLRTLGCFRRMRRRSLRPRRRSRRLRRRGKMLRHWPGRRREAGPLKGFAQCRFRRVPQRPARPECDRQWPGVIPARLEYAHVSDPFWDLAGWAANNDFEDDAGHALLTHYAGRPTSGEESRLKLLCWLYDYVCLLWSELYLKKPRGRDGWAAAAAAAAAESVSGRGRLLAERLKASLTPA